MDIQDRFLKYARDFELTYKDNDWSRLEQYFTERASYDSGLGEVAHGRTAVLAKLEGAVDDFDRRMDNRTIDFAPPVTEGDTVRIRWTARYTKAGVPDVQFAGTEHARFEGERIVDLRDELDTGTEDRLNAWLAQHSDSLSP